jgi:hypothetical protein
MSIVSIRKFLDMDPSPRNSADAANPPCAPACRAWIEQLDTLFPVAPDTSGPGSNLLLPTLLTQFQDAAARAQALRAALDLASARRTAERQSLHLQSAEVQRLVATFNEAVLALASGGDQIAERFNRVESSLVRAARMESLTSVRACLQDTVNLLHREARAEQAESAARVAEFETELARSRTTILSTIPCASPARHEACLMIRQSMSAPSQPPFAITAVVFDRLAATRARFGPAVAAEALAAFTRARAADSAADATVFLWADHVLLWNARAPPAPAALRAAREDLLGKPFEYRTVIGGRPAVLSLLGRWLCGSPECADPDAFIQELDLFASGASRRR